MSATVDNIIEADMVLADGSFVTVNANSHPDLYWAIRGGGGNFGVVTSFLFQAHDVKNIIGGPTFGYAVAGSVSPDGEPKEKFTDEDWEYIERFEFGVNVGIGFGYNVGPGYLYLDTRYMQGLSNLDTEEDVTIKNKGVILSLGFMAQPFNR